MDLKKSDLEEEEEQNDNLVFNNQRMDSKRDKYVVTQAFNFVEDRDTKNLIAHILSHP